MGTLRTFAGRKNCVHLGFKELSDLFCMPHPIESEMGGKWLIPLTRTIALIAKIFKKAEIGLSRHIKMYYHNADEEFITDLFYGQIKYRLRKASKNREIQKAFEADLREGLSKRGAYSGVLDNQAQTYVNGLIADIVLHNKRQEGKSGGDFGLVLIQPQIVHSWVNWKIEKKECSGLLCQAKLKGRDGKWGNFNTKKKRGICQ